MDISTLAVKRVHARLLPVLGNVPKVKPLTALGYRLAQPEKSPANPNSTMGERDLFTTPSIHEESSEPEGMLHIHSLSSLQYTAHDSSNRVSIWP